MLYLAIILLSINLVGCYCARPTHPPSNHQLIEDESGHPIYNDPDNDNG